MIKKLAYKFKELISRQNRKFVTGYKVSEPFTIISCNCIGGLVCHDLQLKFRSPTINLFFESPHFIKFCGNLDYYLSCTLKQAESNTYPVGELDDIKIHFLHYNNFDEAKAAWDRRKTRIVKDNIYLIFSDRDNYTPNLVNEFLKLNYNKVMFSHINYLNDEIVYVEKDCNKQCVEDLTKYIDYKGTKTYEYYFDFPKWLSMRANGKYTIKDCKLHENNNLQLFSVTHKPCGKIACGRIHIGVGNREIEGVTSYDNTGENIASKNGSYCELTALYWIWKNVNCEYAGLEHYRRFFCYKHNLFKANPVTKQYISKKLKKYDVIASNYFKFSPNLYEYYGENHYASDLDECERAIKKLYPEYLQVYKDTIHGKKAVMCNMFVMSKEDTNAYCKWLFDILFEVEKHIRTDDRNAYQKRVYGFLSERLFNVWLNYHNKKILHLPIYGLTDKPVKFKVKAFAKIFIKRKRKKAQIQK